MSDWRRWLGQGGEKAAARHLQQLGYRILDRNVRSRVGELDLVAEDEDTLVFCEVRTRQKRSGVMVAGESIDQRKQARLVRLAEAWLQRHPTWVDRDCRFDALLVERHAGLWHVELVRDAFRPGW